MRAPAEVARKALSLELLIQRYVIEVQAEELGPEQAQALVDGLSVAHEGADLDAFFSESEEEHLACEVGTLDIADSWWDARFADFALLLYALGRVPSVLSVAQISQGMGELLERGFLVEAEGDLDACLRSVEEATLRPEAELAEALGRAAEENEPFVANEGKVPGKDLPPATVLYVLPWLLDPFWPWGRLRSSGPVETSEVS